MCIKTLFLYQRPQGNMGAHALICHAIYIHRLLSLLFKGSRLQSSYLCSGLGDRMMKLQQWACTARGTQMWEMSFCLFSKAAIFLFLGVNLTTRFHQVGQQQSNLCLWTHCNLPQLSLVDEGWYRLPSVLNFSISKRIQIPHSWFWDFRADETSTTLWSGSRVQVWVQVWAPVAHLAITSELCSRRQSKVLTAKLMPWWPSSWGSAPAQLGRVRQPRKHRAFQSRRQSLRAATGWGPARLRKISYHSCDTDSVQESTKI